MTTEISVMYGSEKVKSNSNSERELLDLCSLVWTYNHLIISKYGKQNPIFKTIKDGRAHKACLVEPWFVQPDEKDTQRTYLDKECVAEISKKLDVERITGRPICIAYTLVCRVWN